MKTKARNDIDSGIIADRDAVSDHVKAHALWFQAMTPNIIDDKTAIKWMKYEKMYAVSCLKYFRELDEAKASVSK